MKLVYSYDEVAEELAKTDIVIFDTETSGLLPYKEGKILGGIGFKPLGSESYYMPVRHNLTHEKWKDAFEVRNADMAEAIKLLNALTSKTLIMHNAKFDMAVVGQDGIDFSESRVIDTQAVARIVFEDEPQYRLKVLGNKFIAPQSDEQEKKLAAFLRSIKSKNYMDYPPTLMLPYVCQDLDLTQELYLFFMGFIKERKLEDLLELEIKVTRALFKMERVGVKIDPEYCLQQIEELNSIQAELERRAFEYSGGIPFEMSKAVDLKEVFGSLGISAPGKTEKGADSWAAPLLALIDHPLAKIVVEWRSIVKARATYYDNFMAFKDDEDIIHCNFNQAGAKTGRLSCRQPNLQNIPRWDDEISESEDDEISAEIASHVRRAFVPREGKVLIFADWSQIELRIFADYTNETALMKAFEFGIDIHALTVLTTGKRLPSREEDEKGHDTARSEAKKFSFGLVFGMGIKKMAAGLNCSVDDARKRRAEYFKSFRNAQKFMNKVEEVVQERGYVKNRWNRRRYLDFYYAYQGVNFLAQGTAADLMKDALVRVVDALEPFETNALLTVHDEIILEGPPHEVEQVLEILVGIMTNCDKIRTKLTVGLGWSDTAWSDKKKFDCKQCSGRGITLSVDDTTMLKMLHTRKSLDTIECSKCVSCEGKGYTVKGFNEWIANK